MKGPVESEKGSQVLKEVVYRPTSYGTKEQELYPDKENKKDTAFLYFSVLTAILILFSFGTNLVWTSPVLPKLQSNDTNINPLGEPITTSETSLMMGIPSTLPILTTLVLAKLPDIIGRREMMKYMAIGMLFSNIAVAFGTHIYVYYAAKSTFFIFAGSAMIAAQVYITEIAENHNRGKFGCLMGMAIPSGNLYTFLIGPVTSVRIFTLLTILPLVFTIVFFFLIVPESPVYLASKGKKDESIKALKKLRNNKSKEEIEQDYLQLEDFVKSSNKSEKRGFLSLFKTRSMRNGLMVALIAILTQHLSGVVVIMTFLGPIFNEAGTQLSGNTIAIMVGLVKISVFFLVSFIVERLGRRPLLICSSLLTGVPLFILGLYFFWKNNNAEFIEDIRLLPIAAILIYVVCYSLGLGQIPMAMTGELFPSDVRSVAATFIMTIASIVIAVLNTAYPVASKYLGMHWCIWMFSFFCFSGFFLIYLKLPETKGKSWKEIEEILSK